MDGKLETSIKRHVFAELKTAGAVVDGDEVHVDVYIIKHHPVEHVTLKIKLDSNKDGNVVPANQHIP